MKHSSYPNDTVITGTDRLFGTDIVGDVSKNYQILDIEAHFSTNGVLATQTDMDAAEARLDSLEAQDAPTLLGSTKTLSASDYGKTFYVNGVNCTVTIPFSLAAGFKCKFFSVDTAYIEFAVSGGGTLVTDAASNTAMTEYGWAELEVFGTGFRKVHGQLGVVE